MSFKRSSGVRVGPQRAGARATGSPAGSTRTRPGRRHNSLVRGAIAALGIATIAATACVPPAEPPTTLTVTASSGTIFYGDEIPAVTANYSATPTTEATCTTDATSGSPAGTYQTTCEGASLDGLSVVYVDGAITIEPAPVTVTASSATIGVGDPLPTITATYEGLKNGATAPVVEAVCITDATTMSPAGTYASSCAGASDSNYSFDYVDGTVQVAPAVVTVTASSASVTYGQATQPVTASYSGFKHGETEPAVLASCSTSWTPTGSVGSYGTSCSGASDPSYTFVYTPGTISVTPAALNVIASSASFSAGDPVPAITATYSGLANGDTAPGVAPTCATDATSSSPAGTYTSSCSGAWDPNYAISYTNGTVTVSAVAAPVVVSASSATIVYGDDVPDVTASYSGFGGGQSVPANAATCSTTASSSSGVGTYPTTCSGASDPNYTFVYTSGSITITAASATVTASSVSSTYGSSVAAITATYSGLVNGDMAPATPATCSTTATSSSPAGSYGSSCAGAADANYVFSYTAGTVTIARADATVTASNASFEQGGTAPAISAVYGGFVNGDTVPSSPATCSTNANASSPIGTYVSTCSGAADANYNFAYFNGVVTVTAPALPPITATGYAGYSTSTTASNVTGTSVGATLPAQTIYVTSVATFSTYANVTIATSSGAQAVFCKGRNTTNNSLTGCSGGTGTMSSGAVVSDGSPNGFDVYTIMGGAGAVSPSSLTIIQDVPASYRGMNSRVAATAANGVITVLPTPAATGTFNLVFGICNTGTATYSKTNPACRAGEIVYGPAIASPMGGTVSVSGISSDVTQKVNTFVQAPSSVAQGQTFTVYAAAAGSSIPKYQASQPFIGEPVVNNASGFGIVFPIPQGMEFVSAATMGGSAISSGKMTVKHCTATGTGCDAKLTGNYDATTLPYVKVAIPGVSVNGGDTITMPTVALTLKATGSVSTVAKATLTEFMINLNLTLGFLGQQNAYFDGYPTTASNPGGTPPKAPPVVLSSIQITN
ncbi:MAG: MBG domain-containing protein [Microthrixaceae bacterium]